MPPSIERRIERPGEPPDIERPVADRVTWSVYLLRCADGTFYAGATTDLDRRLRAHGRGLVKYTRGRLPVTVAFAERVGTRGDALRREAALKRLRRSAKEALVAAERRAGDRGA